MRNLRKQALEQLLTEWISGTGHCAQSYVYGGDAGGYMIMAISFKPGILQFLNSKLRAIYVLRLLH